MSRKSVFDVLRENSIDIKADVQRINTYILARNMVKYRGCYYTLDDMFKNNELFLQWKGRLHCTNFHDFMNTVKYDITYVDAYQGNSDAIISMYEIAINLCNCIETICQQNLAIEKTNEFKALRELLDYSIENINYKYYYDEKNDWSFVVENKSEVTAVVEILPTTLTLPTLKYNHKSLKGDVTQKRTIVETLFLNLEPRLSELQKLYSNLEDDISFLANNLNIRHNNITKDYKHYHVEIASMDNHEIEIAYDEMYQQILLAELLLDNVSRHTEIEKLKKRLKSKVSNKDLAE